ncbi:MAG: ABC-2 family transporter protein [Lachnospiraceae bacterium]|nr:ABC-2 family transporter protein [Lachnospiraceae bacterium]
MKQAFRAGLATAKLCFKEQSYFGFANLLAQYLLQAGALAALLMIWRSLFLQGVDLEGMQLSQFYTYTVLSTMLAPLLNIHTPASGWLHDGTMLGLYQRPAGVFAQLAAHTVGGWGMRLLCLSLPVLVISLACGLDMRPVSLWFFPSLILSVLQGFAVDYLFACLLIRMRNLEWTVHCLREALTALFTGSLIPFAVLPWGIGDFLQLSPFGTLAGAPLAIYTGLAEPGLLIVTQIIWNVILWPLAIYCFNASGERMVSYGG